MAYTSCAETIAANIKEDCSKRLAGGYTGRALLIPLSYNPTFVEDAQNPRIVAAVTLAEGQKWCVVDNVSVENPFTDSSMQSNADQGLRRYEKTVHFFIPSRGAQVAKEIVEPLADSAEGYLVIAEKMDRRGDGSFEIIGKMQGMKVKADGISRNEYENSGSISVTMSCREAYSEVVLFDTDYATTKALFETYVASSF